MDVLFLSIFLISPLAIYFYLKAVGFNVFDVNVLSFLIVCLLSFSYIGVFVLYFQLDPYRVEFGVTDKIILLKVMVFSVVSTLLLISGYVVFHKCVGYDWRERIVFENLNVSSLFNTVPVFFVVLASLAYYVYIVDKIALIEIIMNGANADINLVRSEMTNAFPLYGYFRIIFQTIAQYLSLYLLAVFLVSKKWLSFIFFLMSFLIVAFTFLMTTEKAPFVWLMVSYFLVYCLVKNNGYYSKSVAFIIIGSGMMILSLTYIVFMDVKSVASGLWSVFSRAFAGSIQPAYHYLEIFPDKLDFLLGSSFPNPKGILPFEHFPITTEVMKIVNPQDYMNGIVGSMPTVYWGELYANFAIFGVIVVPFIVGVYLAAVSILPSIFSCSIVRVVLTVMLIMHFKDLSVTNLSNYIVDLNLFAIILVSVYLAKVRFKFI